MTAFDRAISAALVKAAGAANKLIELAFPVKDDHPITWADLLAELEAQHDVLEPHQTSDISGHPPTVEAVGPPADAGPTASASHTGIGGHLDQRTTSELLTIAANFVNRALEPAPGARPTGLAGLFVIELRDRATEFAALGD